MRSIELYLDDIILSCDTIASYIGDIDSETIFANEDLVRQAVRARLMDIGEAASRLPRELRQDFPEIEWRDVIAFRKILAHEYFGLNWSVVWRTAIEDLPVLRQTALRMLDNLGSIPPDSG